MTADTTEKRLRPRKTPRQPRAVETRARILDAARAVFAAHGYAAGTTNRIAAEAGMSVGSLYQYFPNKDAILVELVRDHIELGSRAIVAATERGEVARDRDAVAATLRAVIAAMVEIHARDRQLHQVLFEESPRPPALLAELHAIEDVAVAVLASWIAPLACDGTDVELTARIVAVTIESLVHRLVATDRPIGRPFEPEMYVDEVAAVVLGYLATKLRA